MTIDATTENIEMTPAQMNRTLERIFHRSEDIWSDWIKLGRAIVERLDIAIRKAGNRRSGNDYSTQLKKAMGAFHPNYKRLAGNGVISALESCVANYEAVEAFRTRAEIGERLTSPKRVWAAYQEHLGEKLRSDIDDRVIRSGDDEDEAEGIVRPAAGKGERHRPNRRTDIREELEVMLGDAVHTILNAYEQNAIPLDPERNAERIYDKLSAKGHTREDLADLLIAYGMALIRLGESIRAGRGALSAPPTIDLDATVVS